MHGRREQEGTTGRPIGVATDTEQRGRKLEGAIKQARRHEHKKREGNLVQRRKSRLAVREREREMAVKERDTRETGINEHLDTIKTGLAEGESARGMPIWLALLHCMMSFVPLALPRNGPFAPNEQPSQTARSYAVLQTRREWVARILPRSDITLGTEAQQHAETFTQSR